MRTRVLGLVWPQVPWVAGSTQPVWIRRLTGVGPFAVVGLCFMLFGPDHYSATQTPVLFALALALGWVARTLIVLGLRIAGQPSPAAGSADS